MNIFHQLKFTVITKNKMPLTGLAPVAVSILLTIPHRYELIPTRLTWASAQTYCKAKYTDLAITLSDTDWLRLKTVAGRKGLATSASMFVGLWNDVNSWRWSLYDLSLNIANYTNWYAGQPDNLSGNQACVAIITLNQWFDQPCTDLRPFICYDGESIMIIMMICLVLISWLWLHFVFYCTFVSYFLWRPVLTDTTLCLLLPHS